MGNFCSKEKNIQGLDQNNDQQILVAKFDYSKFMKKSDRVEVIKKINSGWYRVRNIQTDEEANIPANFVADVESIEHEDWYYENVSKIEVESYLLSASQPAGAFLVRKPETASDCRYILSVRFNKKKKSPCLKHVDHYPIKTNNMKRYYISPLLDFLTVRELIKTYISKKLFFFNSTVIDKDLYSCVVLTQPCNRKKKAPLYDLCPSYAFNWEIPKYEFNLRKQLGADKYGIIYRGKYKNHTNVAIRILGYDIDPYLYLREVAVLKLFKHKNIAAIYGICSVGKPTYIIQEYVRYGNLLNYMKRHNLIERKRIYLAYQVANGMQYIESRNVVHGNLAARNVLIDINLTAKITDLGLARLLREGNDGKFDCLIEEHEALIKWSAPETFFVNNFTIKSDVWSYGIFLIELFSNGEIPYKNMAPAEVIGFISSGNRHAKPAKMPANLYDFVTKCWDSSADLRPNFNQIKQYFNRYYNE